MGSSDRQPDLHAQTKTLNRYLSRGSKGTGPKAAEGLREECEGLDEIDEYASKATAGKLDKDERALLDVVRTGGAWQKVAAFWSGHKDEFLCDLCGGAKETAAHTIWTCCALKEEREQADKLLAQCDGETSPEAGAVRHGAGNESQTGYDILRETTAPKC